MHAMMLDAKGTWDDTVRRFAKSEETRRRIFNNSYYQRASESLSGSQEYMAMERLLEMHTLGEYDLAVLDPTDPQRPGLSRGPRPPDGGARRGHPLLADPRGARTLQPTAAGARLFGRGREAMFSVLERFMGADVIRGLADFIGAMSELLDGPGRARSWSRCGANRRRSSWSPP